MSRSLDARVTRLETAGSTVEDDYTRRHSLPALLSHVAGVNETWHRLIAYFRARQAPASHVARLEGLHEYFIPVRYIRKSLAAKAAADTTLAEALANANKPGEATNLRYQAGKLKRSYRAELMAVANGIDVATAPARELVAFNFGPDFDRLGLSYPTGCDVLDVFRFYGRTPRESDAYYEELRAFIATALTMLDSRAKITPETDKAAMEVAESACRAFYRSPALVEIETPRPFSREEQE